MTPEQAWKSMPKSVKVGYIIYKVVSINSIDAHERRVAGEARLLRNVIGILPELQPSKMANVLLHEILHCICWHQNIDEHKAQEEEYVTGIANGLAAVMLDNPGLFAWIENTVRAK
jgi:predicted metal-dependent peptidase